MTVVGIATGMLNDADKSWEAFGGKEGNETRNKSGAAPSTTNLWDDASLASEDRYKGLTPPISPAQVGLGGRDRRVRLSRFNCLAESLRQRGCRGGLF